MNLTKIKKLLDLMTSGSIPYITIGREDLRGLVEEIEHLSEKLAEIEEGSDPKDSSLPAEKPTVGKFKILETPRCYCGGTHLDGGCRWG